ncbi:hypothetical protein [Glycomyces sp. NRRL B-16210]|uniref:hypothetical protein n=1 Tax=Glycomyces sp. NRRL B-16210 TaxID=1463821 RepID=UPI0004BF4F75|nr:hypothetical protein [Glycomyces sp. NRRL B-16210]
MHSYPGPPTGSTLAAQTVSLSESGPAAQMYGSLAAVLAGFAFTGLVLYLERQQHRPKGHGRSATRYRHIDPTSVVKTLFYAMCALVICAFLYARLAGNSDTPGRVLLGLSLCGTVLGPAVLSLFYALNLAMATHDLTQSSARTTRWAVAAVGPAVVVSLMADLLDSSWRYSCGQACPAWQSPRWWCLGLALVFLLAGLLLTLPAVQRVRRLRLMVRWLLRRNPVQSAADLLLTRPHFPALVTVVIGSAIGVGSFWSRDMTSTPGEDLDPRAWVYPVLVLTAIVLGIFAFASGSVLDPAPTARPVRRKVAGRFLDFAVVIGTQRVRVSDAATGRVLGTVVGFKSKRSKFKPWNAIGARLLAERFADAEPVKDVAARILEADRSDRPC